MLSPNFKSHLPISEFSGYHCKNSLNMKYKGFIKLLVSAQKGIDNHITFDQICKNELQ